MVTPATHPAAQPPGPPVAWNVVKSNMPMAGRFAASAHSVASSVSVPALFLPSAATPGRSSRSVSRSFVSRRRFLVLLFVRAGRFLASAFTASAG